MNNRDRFLEQTPEFTSRLNSVVVTIEENGPHVSCQLQQHSRVLGPCYPPPTPHTTQRTQTRSYIGRVSDRISVACLIDRTDIIEDLMPEPCVQEMQRRVLSATDVQVHRQPVPAPEHPHADPSMQANACVRQYISVASMIVNRSYIG